MFKSRIRTPCVHLIGTYNQGDLSGLFIYHNIPILQIIMAKSYWLIDARQRLLQQRNLIAKLIQLKLFGLFLGTPDTSLLKPPPDSDNTKQISLWSAITHISCNDNRRWHKKIACLSLCHSETSLGPGMWRSWNSLSFLAISADIFGSRRSAADSVWESKGASNTRMIYHR